MTAVLLCLLLVAIALEVVIVMALRDLRRSTDFSALTNRLETILAHLEALSSMRASVAYTGEAIKALPGALKAMGDKIDRMFQEFEEKTLPEEAQQIGAAALSRISRARAEMERQEEQSLADFNATVEKGGKAMTPIVARGGL